MGYAQAPWVFKGNALYQLQLVKSEEARKHVPEDFKLVEAFGYTLGGFYLARYGDSPVGAFNELVVLAGLVWNKKTSCAWAARVYVDNKEARNHGIASVGLPSRIASFEELVEGPRMHSVRGGAKAARRSWWHQPIASAPPPVRGGGDADAAASPSAALDAPLMIRNMERSARGLVPPVCVLGLPDACGARQWSGPRIKLSLPSFSGATPEVPSLLQYACDLTTNVRLARPAAVQVPELEAKDAGNARKEQQQRSEMLPHIMLGKPLIMMAFDHMVMTVEEPQKLVLPAPAATKAA